jgi:oligoendopeptidase F
MIWTKTMFFVVITTAVFFLVGCGDQNNASGFQSQITSENVKKDAAKAIATAKAYTLNQREEYQKQIQEKLNSFDQKLEALKSEAGSVKDNAKAQYEDTIAELQKKINEASNAFKELKNKSGDAWSEIKVRMDQRIDDLQKAFDQNKA